MTSMKAIRITTGCRASGRGYAAGETVMVPGDISADDAALLVRMGRAEAVALPPTGTVAAAKPAEKKKREG